ncbi:MAG: dihydrodipicolinate synthase family protein [Chloroflexi bacterium]|nr:dihydrodipicolinate synthase family protein [Chloroflexota bacterium]
MSASTWSGVIPPVATPFTPDGRLDTGSLKRLCNFQIDAGVHGLFMLGSTSEGPELTDEYRETVMRTGVEVSAGRVPVMSGISETSTARAIAQGLRAKAAGCNAVVLASPYYHLNSQSEIMDHFRAVKAAVGLPIMAYDIPVLVKVKLEPRTVIQLAEEGVIAGLKDSSGNLETFREIIMGTRQVEGFSIFTGSETLVDLALLSGAHGVVPGVGNVVPGEYVKLYNAARKGDWVEAGRIQEKLYKFFFKLIKNGPAHGSFSASALGGFKSALKALGVIDHTTMYAPMVSFGEAEEARVREVLQEFGYLSS